MYALKKIFVLLVAAVAVAGIAHGEEDVEVSDLPETQSTAGAPEMTEEQKKVSQQVFQRVFSLLSDECKMQLQAASQGSDEMTDECKAEVQAAVSASQNNDFQPPKKSEFIDPNASDPTWIIMAFTMTFLGGIGGYIVYVNKEMSKLPQRPKKKKMSKKKMEKARRKMGPMDM